MSKPPPPPAALDVKDMPRAARKKFDTELALVLTAVPGILAHYRWRASPPREVQLVYRILTVPPEDLTARDAYAVHQLAALVEVTRSWTDPQRSLEDALSYIEDITPQVVELERRAQEARAVLEAVKEHAKLLQGEAA